MATWTKTDIDYLKTHYKECTIEQLESNLKRPWSAIKTKASKLNLKRSKHMLENLMNGSLESFYWVGFLMADGFFGTNEIKLKLSVDDDKHLKKYTKFIGSESIYYTSNQKYICTTASNSKVVPKIKEFFDLSNRKTYIPPNFENIVLSDDHFLSLFCGFVDGDGCIRRQGTVANPLNTASIVIKCHSSWVDVFSYMEKRIYKIFGRTPKQTARVTSDIAILGIYDFPVLKQIKTKAQDLGLPILTRKWDKIDLNFESIEPKRVKINNIIYPSIKEAARHYDVAPVTIKRWATVTGKHGAVFV